ncbi:MAG: preprotein translocase subunit SecG [Candidatus Blackburnbacteria bacterium RIFCSPHIGHO2_02_FULL_39_13]|uniref:Protein-export membrane protein SecG n=1 Tax=Candidatus Blackburnbacteria bacterium RIFCSPLOWO2_01_FULL_40_20 TaxID=1797519 RepID=A0A1G1VCQ0_9BACT|nr:MAG: preprotein translocase subunit SecG [Candidatus Blackburnbacteria bacterium RIFCSPHIGHO2_01_FULL_40_17]OGY09123.1 MAG: preprotein translocase subunit SecG [Candidatus Blackburnbacteria bacterium RIFCSPHIGHO2_02_FULL_39_13]OGY13067.1 MAG: preprotein translocase subunit SecG [Candidatus Blackburnbacteria bacterium RIFCSPLOWO2_01_FULL_40_20]HBL52361.1 preprotein translocase subunit SecG [Candidatus Blackburnbacteria bacterium]
MNLFIVAQTVLAVLLIVTILLQSRGAGLGSAWGGEGEMYGTRRGVEKLLFRATVLIAASFIIVSFASLVI